ncbi:hypothetical protein [Geothermobacter hydrogeniphilus]|uniref:hypothetical protein n=1 Tax=Geothermobacter hydrogeniphilus TaxID=1969733 RepID=UPI001304ECC0|nr:hypothetical protein [Geothermobacter hydrogeniphilus]
MHSTEKLRQQNEQLTNHLDRLRELFQRLENATAHQRKILSRQPRKTGAPAD